MTENSYIHLTDMPLEADKVTALVSNSSQGGVVVFTGNVRDRTKGKKVLRLEYQAYQPMAISEMEKIRQKVLAQWPQSQIAIHHRVGTLQIGEAAVIIAVSTPHRAQAFKACELAIDTLKEQVPIWKKEIFEDGEVWVAAHP
ncbi:MAG: molybdenum cofactor biosynthesis protein MoaE [Cyclobacteriaceae bacterium]|nr:molybdenum cofactor biosynthesis protein MoaE [Cyclobacteriaceae bacterium]